MTQAVESTGQSLVEKFQAMGLALKSQFLEREDVIDGMLVAALAGEHVLLVGPPGSAKSALVVAFSKAVAGTKYFEWLLGRFTVPEELFGPMSLKGLEKEEYRRVTTGKLPEANVAFLDEVFKAGGAILNTLLPVLNERKFYNNGAPVSVPLRMVVGASNELPDGAELGALYDRFVVRYWIDYLGSADNFVRMVQGIPKGHEAGVTLTEWDTARDEVATVKVGEDIARELHKLRAKLASDHSIVLSDRRWKQCVRLLQAAAWLGGETEVLEDHLVALAPALWDERAQIEPVKKECTAAAGQSASEAKRIESMVSDLIAKIPQTAGGEKASPEVQNQMVAANREGARAIAKLKELAINAKTKRAKALAEKTVEAVEAKLAPLRIEMRKALDL